MCVNNIGYTDFVFRQLGAKRPRPQWYAGTPTSGNEKATIVTPTISKIELEATLSSDQNRRLREAVSNYFMSNVLEHETYKYKLTAALGQLHQGNVLDGAIANVGTQFAGILYPSARMWANGDNLVLLPWFVDKHLTFRKAAHIRIEQSDGTKFSITTLDVAREFDADGNLLWFGRLPKWTLASGQEAKFIAMPGRDSDGDYLTSYDGSPCYWLGIDVKTGKVIEAD